MKISIQYLYPSGVTLTMTTETAGDRSRRSFNVYAHALSDEPGDYEMPTHYRTGDAEEWMDMPASSTTISRRVPESEEEAQFLKKHAGTHATEDYFRDLDEIQRRGVTMEWRDANGEPIEDAA